MSYTKPHRIQDNGEAYWDPILALPARNTCTQEPFLYLLSFYMTIFTH